MIGMKCEMEFAKGALEKTNGARTRYGVRSTKEGPNPKNLVSRTSYPVLKKCVVPVLFGKRTCISFVLVFHRILDFKTGLNFYSGPFFYRRLKDYRISQIMTADSNRGLED